MSKLRDSIIVVLLAGLVVGCQKGGDAVDETTQKAPSTPSSAQSAGVSTQGSSESDEPEKSEENLSKEEFAKVRIKMECAIEELGSELQPSDIRSRVLEVMGVPEPTYERAENRYGAEEKLSAAIQKRVSRWCTEKRVRRALEMDDGSE